jgi:hypothetical protein
VARRALENFDAGFWGRKYPAIAQIWRRDWEHVIPFFAFLVAVRRIIYTTNAIDSLNAELRRAVRTRGHFPTDEAIALELAATASRPPGVYAGRLLPSDPFGGLKDKPAEGREADAPEKRHHD